MSVKCGIHHEYHPTAADVRACYARRNTARSGRPTEMAARSVDAFSRYDSLIAEREAATERDYIDPVFAATKAGQSRLRDVAARQSERLRTFQATRPARTPVKGDGVFRFRDDFYQVKRAVHGSGRLYANRFNSATRSWVFEPGAMRKLAEEDRLSREEAAKFGKLYGECMICHRTLTDQDSIDAGIGPVCAGKEKAGYFA